LKLSSPIKGTLVGFVSLLPGVRTRIAGLVVVILGSPRPVAEMIRALELPEPPTCYQFDLYQAERLREELVAFGTSAHVECLPDLWDLPSTFQTAIYPMVKMGERELKIDMIDQSFHVLRPGGTLISLSESPKDLLCPKWHKKIFGQCSELPVSLDGSAYWSMRKGDGERRRHEQTFHARIGEGPSLEFITRPGVFSYGRLDDGARALVEIAELAPNEKILDLGCGLGANGILANFKAGEGCHITFVDSNVRAMALAELNAKKNALPNYRLVPTARVEGMMPGMFDAVLANPPYYAQFSIARTFVEGAKPLLKPGGRLYLVTKQTDQMATLLHEFFEDLGVAERRGYAVFEAIAPGGG